MIKAAGGYCHCGVINNCVDFDFSIIGDHKKNGFIQKKAHLKNSRGSC